MNTDSSPPSEFLLESLVSPALLAGDPHTLTLQLALGTTRAGPNPMAGKATTGKLVVAGPGTERAAVLLADATPITITFQGTRP